MVYSTPPQFTRFEANPAIHTTKWIASRNGTSHSERFRSPSPTPQTPTTQAIDSRKIKYAARYNAPTQTAGATAAANNAQGKPCVNISPKKDAGRTVRTVRAQRS